MNNNEVKQNICNYLKEGMLKRDASVYAGISEATFYRWVDEDESFKSQVEASVLEYKHTLIKNVNTTATKDGKFALEVLKRRFPKDWNGDYEEQINTGKTTNEEVAELLQKVLHMEDKHEEIVSTFS